MRDPDAFLVARLRFKHLALVESLGTLRSIRKTANASHMSEPAVSKALAEIETSFGFALFERSPSGVVPTKRGEAVIEGARLLLNSLRHVRLTAAGVEGRQVLRIGVVPFLALTILPNVLQAISSRSPMTEVDLREGSVPQLLHMLNDGKVDAVLASIPQELVARDSGESLSQRLLYTDTLAIIAPKGHPLGGARGITWKHLEGERWILPPSPSALETAVSNAFVSQGLVPPQAWILLIHQPN